MAGNNIIGVGKNISDLPGGTGKTSSKKEENAGMSFMDIINSSNYAPSANVSADTAKDDGISEIQGANTRKDYNPGTSKKNEIEVKKDITAEELKSESGCELEDYSKEVNEILKEELGVSEEEVAKAMELLGLNPMDLVDPKNLILLIQQLSGALDAGVLLMSEPFQNIMTQVNSLTKELCAELGISMEELTALCKEISDMTEPVMPDTMADSDAAVKQPDEKAANMQNQQMGMETAKSPADVITASGQSEQVSEAVQTTVQNGEEDVGETAKSLGQTAEAVEETQQPDADKSFQDSKGDALKDNSRGMKADHTSNAANGINANSQTIQPFAAAAEAAQANMPQVDIADIIEQITRSAKVTFTAQSTSMEMQLNPQNLGKIYLHITQQEGAVRAEIAAQSETVKNALEAQLVDLRQSLNQQGIKVDAIEVTVASHEFEQNLDSNAKQQEQMQQQLAESEKRGRRNLNLNDMEQLSGLMTEEETLVAKIMQDNGNQVDLNA